MDRRPTARRGKYGPLEEWLRHQPKQPFQVTFAEIEELLGEPLPRSSHIYPAHWLSDAGSRPGRAIRDAGFHVRELDLVEERVVLEPTDIASTDAEGHGPVLPTSETVLAEPVAIEEADRPGGTVPDLLREYAELMRTLHDRGVLQTGNNPASDYAEGLVARAFNLERTSGSAYGYDARDPRTRRRYQVKARRFSRLYRNVGMGFIRGLDGEPFDELVAVVFAEDFSIHLAARMPLAVVRQIAVWVPYVGAHQVRLTRAVLSTPGVDDVAGDLRAVAGRWT
jgi:hypothetical protein